MGTIHMMAIDRGFKRETTIFQSVDMREQIAGQTHCSECGGSGDWTQFHPEPDGPIACVECKGTGLIWVSI
jgi:hypothetical protein